MKVAQRARKMSKKDASVVKYISHLGVNRMVPILNFQHVQVMENL